MKEEGTRNKDCLAQKSILKLCLREKVWKYRGEGNANLVIALPKERLILRLHKWERDKELTPQVEAEEQTRVWREVLFCRSVMVPLLGSAYIQPPRLAFLDKDEIIKLDTALKPLRPVYRLHKGIKFSYVTIYPDYALMQSCLKTTSHNSGCSNNCRPFLPLQCIENRNYNMDDLSSKFRNNLSYCRNIGSLNCSPNHFESDTENESNDDFDEINIDDSSSDNFDEDIDDEDDDDLFIENYNNINKSIEIPSRMYCKTDNCMINCCQLIPPSLNCNKIRGIRRFSTGSDCNFVPNPMNSSFILNPSMVSSSAPVSSQLILDMNNRKNPVFCVEIKPKQGWIPSMDRFNPKCTFCLNQYLKLSKGLVETISRYCPLDLFSGNEIRMRNALKNLLLTPQNNLKLFRDGVIIYSEDMKTDLFSVFNEWFKSSSKNLTKDDNLNKLTDKFCDLVINALTTDLTDGESFPDIEDLLMPECLDEEENNTRLCDIVSSNSVINSSRFLIPQSCDWTSQPLPTNCILDRILKIQQLERSGSEAVYKKYRSNCIAEGDYEYVTKLCDHPDGVLKLDIIQRYLLATTAKDCSVLIAFQRIANDHCNTIRNTHITKDFDGVRYVWNIGISDLDPKPLSCIEKHRKRDADVLSSFKEYFRL